VLSLQTAASGTCHVVHFVATIVVDKNKKIIHAIFKSSKTLTASPPQKNQKSAKILKKNLKTNLNSDFPAEYIGP
jgi:hypothetical protein